MLPEYFHPAKLYHLFHLLFCIDKDLADQHRAASCPYCGGPLHYGNYPRKPRDIFVTIPDEYFVRQSLCCGNKDCRRRSLPPSVLFMGRRVFWRGAILVVMALRQGRPHGASMTSLIRCFEVSRQTINRWGSFFREIFPKSDQWQRLRGRVCASVGDHDLPGSLLDFFSRHHPEQDVAFLCCLRFLATGFIA